MDLSLSFYVVSALAILVTGISKSGFGGGLGVMSVPAMSLFAAPQFAVAVLMPILLVMDLIIVWRYRSHWSRGVVMALLPGALVGLMIGALTFEYMRADVIKFIVGLLALFFVGQFLLQSCGVRVGARGSVLIPRFLGVISGFASYVAHAGGPPVKGYLLRQGLDKTVFVGTNTMFFFSMNVLKTFAYGSAGMMGQDSLRVSLMLAPCLFVGVFAGLRLHRLIEQKIFVKIVYGFLAVAAVKLLYDSAAGHLLMAAG